MFRRKREILHIRMLLAGFCGKLRSRSTITRTARCENMLMSVGCFGEWASAIVFSGKPYLLWCRWSIRVLKVVSCVACCLHSCGCLFACLYSLLCVHIKHRLVNIVICIFVLWFACCWNGKTNVNCWLGEITDLIIAKRFALLIAAAAFTHGLLQLYDTPNKHI